jgi:hypothetical protein
MNPVATAGSFLEARQAARVACASGKHLPQQVPTPRSLAKSRTRVAPHLAACRIWRSETALHTQTIMAAIVNANANDCQYRYVTNAT